MDFINYLYTSLVARVMNAKEDIKNGKEDGQTLVEYGLIIALLSIVVIGVLTVLGDELIVVFNTVRNELASTAPASPPDSPPATP